MNDDHRREQEDWIKAHGSERLRKAVALGMLEVSQGVYRDERVNEAHRGWLSGVGAKLSPILNPTLEELDYLERMRRFWPDAVLEKMLRHDRWVSVVTVEREVLPLRRVGPVKIFTYCSPLETFAHTGEIPAQLRRAGKGE